MEPVALSRLETDLTATVQRHKATIRDTKRQLKVAAEQLAEVRRRCREMGIGFAVQPERRTD